MGRQGDLEKERERLHWLIENGASPEEILKQSEEVDKYIIEYYRERD